MQKRIQYKGFQIIFSAPSHTNSVGLYVRADPSVCRSRQIANTVFWEFTDLKENVNEAVVKEWLTKARETIDLLAGKDLMSAGGLDEKDSKRLVGYFKSAGKEVFSDLLATLPMTPLRNEDELPSEYQTGRGFVQKRRQ